jgi:acetoin utilization protein AcuB
MKNLVGQWMTTSVVAVSPKTTLPEASRLMRVNHIRRLPVVDKGRIIGIVTLGDMREASPSDATSLSVYELNYLLVKLTIDQIMTREPITIAPSAQIYEAADLMLRHKIGGLPVVEGGKLIGMITESDIFRVLVQEAKQAAANERELEHAV